MFTIKQTKQAVEDALKYLRKCDIIVPHFKTQYKSNPHGCMVLCDEVCTLTTGTFISKKMADWFMMHELVHVLCYHYEPIKNRRFAREFGEPQPSDYLEVTWTSALPSICRPAGYASIYGKLGGGEEHFAELVAYMYTSVQGFAAKPPDDLAKAWKIAWSALKRMV
jgi:hypothetical protein